MVSLEKTRFSDWLKRTTHSIFVIGYPFSVNRWDIVNTMTAFLPEMTAVSMDGNGYAYDDVDQINKGKILLFDDISALISQWSDYTLNRESKIMILSTWGDTIEELAKLANIFPSLQLLTFEDTKEIRFLLRVYQVKLSKEHDGYWDKIRKEEEPGYPDSRKIGLYYYPEDQRDITGPDTIKDPERGHLGWIGEDQLNDLDQNGPKLAMMINEVVKNLGDGRQLIFSGNEDRYGIDLIRSFLSLSDIETSVNFDDGKEVIVTTGIPLNIIEGVEHLHIPDEYNFVKCRNLLRKIVRQKKLIIHVYIALSRYDKSVDEILANDFLRMINESDNYLLLSNELQGKLTFTEQYGLTVQLIS